MIQNLWSIFRTSRATVVVNAEHWSLLKTMRATAIVDYEFVELI